MASFAPARYTTPHVTFNPSSANLDKTCPGRPNPPLPLSSCAGIPSIDMANDLNAQAAASEESRPQDGEAVELTMQHRREQALHRRELALRLAATYSRNAPPNATPSPPKRVSPPVAQSPPRQEPSSPRLGLTTTESPPPQVLMSTQAAHSSPLSKERHPDVTSIPPWSRPDYIPAETDAETLSSPQPLNSTPFPSASNAPQAVPYQHNVPSFDGYPRQQVYFSHPPVYGPPPSFVIPAYWSLPPPHWQPSHGAYSQQSYGPPIMQPNASSPPDLSSTLAFSSANPYGLGTAASHEPRAAANAQVARNEYDPLSRIAKSDAISSLTRILPRGSEASNTAAHRQDQSREYATLHRVALRDTTNTRINKVTSASNLLNKSGALVHGQTNQRDVNVSTVAKTASTLTWNEKYGNAKKMRPAPQPLETYLTQAWQEPKASESPAKHLVILDLNGTLIYRPAKQKRAKKMIERPFLQPFLDYCFQHFKVMVWSSAKPENVKDLVKQFVKPEYRPLLVAQLARDSFNLPENEYKQNVQVYKNLQTVWCKADIQRHHPEYATGATFGQHNTILIDDTSLKANAQPHNLLLIPEFKGEPVEMTGDVLQEVAGFLELLRSQKDVSKYMRKFPFKGDGMHVYPWPESVEMMEMVKEKPKGREKKAKKSKKANPPDSSVPQGESPSMENPDFPHDPLVLRPASLRVDLRKDW